MSCVNHAFETLSRPRTGPAHELDGDAVSRAHEWAELLADGVHRLAGQLEQATGERVAAFEVTAENAARCGVRPAKNPMDRGLETDRQHDGERDRVPVLRCLPEIVAEEAEFRHIDRSSGLTAAAISIMGSSTLTAMNAGAGTRRRSG